MKTSDISAGRNLFLRRIMTLAMVFTLSVTLPSCTKSDSSSGTLLPTTTPLVQVVMRNSSYTPQTLTISQGTTILWINGDPYDHTITSGTPGHPSGVFNSGAITPHGEFSYTFDSIGTYNYYCKFYLNRMTGTINVQ